MKRSDTILGIIGRWFESNRPDHSNTHIFLEYVNFKDATFSVKRHSICHISGLEIQTLA